MRSQPSQSASRSAKSNSNSCRSMPHAALEAAKVNRASWVEWKSPPGWYEPSCSDELHRKDVKARDEDEDDLDLDLETDPLYLKLRTLGAEGSERHSPHMPRSTHEFWQ